MDDLKQLKKIVKFVYTSRYSDFYRKKYKKAPINPLKIRTISDFKKLPFLTRKELVDTQPLDRIFVPEDQLAGASTTSGTSEHPSLIIPKIRGKGDHYDFRQAKKNGIKRLMLLISANSTNRFLTQPPPANFFVVFADISNLALAAQVAAETKIDALYSTANSLYFFLPYLQEKYDAKYIKDVYLGGELCSEKKYTVFKNFFPKAVIRANYGMSETQWVGWQCKYLAGKTPSVYHFFQSFYPEVIDPQTGEDLPYGQEGELVLTALKRKAFIPVRYRTNDLIMVSLQKCACKKTLFEFIGRVGSDYISVAGARLVKNEVEKILSKEKKIVLDFKFYILEKLKDSKIIYDFQIQLIPKDKRLVANTKLEQSLAKKLETGLKVSPTLTFGDLIKKGIFLPLKVSLVEKLPQEAKRKTFEMVNNISRKTGYSP